MKIQPTYYASRLLVFLLLGVSILFAGEKQELKWKTFDAGFAEAKKSNKKIMLDIYTDWCGWCKRLDKDTYGNEKVMDYLNSQYVVIKLNAESATKLNFKDKEYSEAGMAQALGATGYPTIVFFDGKGEPITSIPGYVDAERFLPILTFIGDDSYKSMTWEEYTKKSSPDKKTADKKETNKKDPNKKD
ncbi:MAG TPA: thioredoxin fold domain-containing protein [Bacteroidota bacterium]|nr:thioredoxin fold domain-containing protein [Bacteroidota bacterium]